MPLDQNQKFAATDSGLLRRIAAATEQSMFSAFGPDLNRIADNMEKDEQRLFLTPERPHEDADCLRAIASEYDKAAQPKTRDKLYELAFKIDKQERRVKDAFEAGWITNASHTSGDYLTGAMAADYEVYVNSGPGYFLERIGEALERAEEAENQTGMPPAFTKIGFDPNKEICEHLKDHMTGTVVVPWPHRVFHAAHDIIEQMRNEIETLKGERDGLRSDCARMVRKVDSLERRANPMFEYGGTIDTSYFPLYPVGVRGPEPIKAETHITPEDVEIRGEPRISDASIATVKTRSEGDVGDIYQKIADNTAAEVAEHIAKSADADGYSLRMGRSGSVRKSFIPAGEPLITGVDYAGEEPFEVKTAVSDVLANGPELDALYGLRDDVLEEIAALDDADFSFSRKYRGLKGKLIGLDQAIEAVVAVQNPDED